MFGKAFSLFRARGDKAEMARIAGEMASDGASNYVDLQFGIYRFWAKFWLAAAILACLVVAGLGLWAAIAWHELFIVITLIFGGLAVLAIRAWLAINRKIAAARLKAKEMAKDGAEAVKAKWAERSAANTTQSAEQEDNSE